MSNRKQPSVRREGSQGDLVRDRPDQINKFVWFGKNRPAGGLFPSMMREHVDNIPIKQKFRRRKRC